MYYANFLGGVRHRHTSPENGARSSWERGSFNLTILLLQTNGQQQPEQGPGGFFISGFFFFISFSLFFFFFNGRDCRSRNNAEPSGKTGSLAREALISIIQMEWRWRGERERIGRKKKYQIKSNKDFCFLGGDRTEGKNHTNRKITHNPNVMCVCLLFPQT